MIRKYVTIGQDDKITVTAYYKGTTTVIPLNTQYDGYGIVLYYLDEETAIAKYSKNSVTGYLTDLDTTNESSGIVVVNLKRSVTLTGISNKDVYMVFVAQSSDADFEDSRFVPVSDPKYCFTFVYAPVGTIPDLDP